MYLTKREAALLGGLKKALDLGRLNPKAPTFTARQRGPRRGVNPGAERDRPRGCAAAGSDWSLPARDRAGPVPAVNGRPVEGTAHSVGVREGRD